MLTGQGNSLKKLDMLKEKYIEAKKDMPAENPSKSRLRTLTSLENGMKVCEEELRRCERMKV